jgi:hypothetical protein
LVNLFCWAHVRRHFVRAGDANPVQLRYWTQAWLERIRDLYAAHEDLIAAWQQAAASAPRDKAAAATRLGEAGAAWDAAVIWTVTATAQMAGLNVLTYLTVVDLRPGEVGTKHLAELTR